MATNVKTEDDYYEGPPPPDKISSNKPKLPSNRITPVKTDHNKQTTTTGLMTTTPASPKLNNGKDQYVVSNATTSTFQTVPATI